MEIVCKWNHEMFANAESEQDFTNSIWITYYYSHFLDYDFFFFSWGSYYDFDFDYVFYVFDHLKQKTKN